MAIGTVFTSRCNLFSRPTPPMSWLEFTSVKHDMNVIYLIVDCIQVAEGGEWYAVLSGDHGLVYMLVSWYNSHRYILSIYE
jgi:hypothetical protein